MEKRQYFGTDGVRGRVGLSPVTPAEVLHLGWAAGRVLGASHARGRFIIGKDTRISGYLLESALEAGLSAAGVDIALTGPLPTPGIALLTRQVGACGGIVISASHNPYHDNGIKFFSESGRKLDDDTEASIEALMSEPMSTVAPEALGKAERLIDALPRYAEHCRSTLPPGVRLDGLKIAVDCANGAAYQVGPLVLRELGAEVVAVADPARAPVDIKMPSRSFPSMGLPGPISTRLSPNELSSVAFATVTMIPSAVSELGSELNVPSI